MISQILTNPKKLFILDGLGAITSSILLGFVLVRFESFFGIPTQTLYLLALLPIFFALYDLYCYRQGNLIRSIHLQGIAIINLIYCCLSLALTTYHFEVVTSFGWAYILAEIAIVVTLVILEFKAANRIKGLHQ